MSTPLYRRTLSACTLEVAHSVASIVLLQLEPTTRFNFGSCSLALISLAHKPWRLSFIFERPHWLILIHPCLLVTAKCIDTQHLAMRSLLPTLNTPLPPYQIPSAPSSSLLKLSMPYDAAVLYWTLSDPVTRYLSHQAHPMMPAAHPNPYQTPLAPHPQPCATCLPHASGPFGAHHSHRRHLLHANPSFHYWTALPTPSEHVDHAAALLSLPARPV